MQGFPVKLWLLSSALTMMLAGCVTGVGQKATIATAPACANGGYATTAELVFGRVTDDGSPGVSESDFAKFLDGEVSPRFPAGLTVMDAEGRWTPPAGSMIREPAKLVMIVLPGNRDDGSKLDAVRQAYALRFHQHSVLLLTHGDCVSF